MTLSLIVAMSENRVMGRDQKLPWHIPADLMRFKLLTTGHAVVMGRKTYESMGRLLPHRSNIIITRNRDLKIPGAVMASSLEEALTPFAKSTEEVFVIGGSEIFRQSFHMAHKIYLTLIHQKIQGDVIFPQVDLSFFKVSFEEKHLDETIPFSFIDYIRI